MRRAVYECAASSGRYARRLGDPGDAEPGDAILLGQSADGRAGLMLRDNLCALSLVGFGRTAQRLALLLCPGEAGLGALHQ